MAVRRLGPIVWIVLLVLLAGLAGLLAHHHGLNHEDRGCVACVLLASCMAALPALLLLPALLPLNARLCPAAPPVVSTFTRKSFSARAPPVR